MGHIMRLLALETSGMSGSVAVLEPPGPPLVVPLEPSQRSARALAPAVREALTRAGWKPSDVEVVAVTSGPGSFTGLRIGVTTAKALCYALGAQLVAVDTLDALARQAGDVAQFDRLHTVLDAHRNELFAASFRREGDKWLRAEPTHLIVVEAWLAALQAGDVVTGPVVAKLQSRLPSGVGVIDEARRVPSAGAVAELAADLYTAGRRDDPWTLVPWYGRLAAAEEKRQAKSP
jgi:tRNA threonylcarbamoyladenosine biosynthesis protein TsaB